MTWEVKLQDLRRGQVVAFTAEKHLPEPSTGCEPLPFLAHTVDAYAALCGLGNANLFCGSSARRGLICMFQFPE